ncbi:MULTISPECIES: hypothetical protein [Gammaproteobacteria]|uniref:hypothetical protein n=1 Tax=Gammaproteobacteria TaxID=1236 RepID=UPI001912C941|nr:MULTISPECIES: hypothetical protein [Gammaproteobacteria]MBK5299745.1 hypothetical protein [Bacillus sp. TH86]MBK5319514.1 hypothetical protein [Bacillus sp. TH59]MBK5334464.1 hypothetical protein [Bacillus sp. TH57]MBK5308553.1 hypothetical protein [Pseudomonas sp. TH71]MBK5314013.1 hypothetical protein [Erwinia sp. TH79]
MAATVDMSNFIFGHLLSFVIDEVSFLDMPSAGEGLSDGSTLLVMSAALPGMASIFSIFLGVHDFGDRKVGGTLGDVEGYGVGNPRESVSGRVASLLKFNPLKLKGSIEKPLKRRAYDRTNVPVKERLRGSDRQGTQLHHLVEKQ